MHPHGGSRMGLREARGLGESRDDVGWKGFGPGPVRSEQDCQHVKRHLGTCKVILKDLLKEESRLGIGLDGHEHVL